MTTTLLPDDEVRRPAPPRAARSVRQRVPAGLMDSAFSSLATFGVSLVAVHELAAGDLGVYSLGFTAFLFIAVVPAALIFMPAEAAAIAATEGSNRLGVLRRSLPAGAAVAVVSAVVGTAIMVSIPTGAAWNTRVGVAIGLLLLSAVSPIQDHLRRLLHAATHSWAAAAVSMTQVGVVLVGVSVLLLAGLGRSAWLPFTILGTANLVSLITALVLAKNIDKGSSSFVTFKAKSLLGTGQWLLSSQFAGSALGFVLVAVVSAFSGSSAAGYAEAARTLCQPPTVLIIGLLSVMGPETQAAMAQRRYRRLRKLQRNFGRPVLAISALWGILILVPGISDPLRHLFPRAYQVHWLLVIMLVGQIAGYANSIFAGPFLVVGYAKRLATTGYVTMAIALAIALVLRNHGALGLAFAGLAELVQLAIFLVRQRRLMEEIRRLDESPDPDRLPEPAVAELVAVAAPG